MVDVSLEYFLRVDVSLAILLLKKIMQMIPVTNVFKLILEMFETI